MPTENRAAEQQVLDRVYELAYEYEGENGCCAQCVLAAVQDVLEVGTDDVFKASHTLSAGGALTGRGTCGALAGAMLAVGASHGRRRADFANGPGMESFAVAKRVYDGFVDEFGSAVCEDVQTKVMGRSFDMWNGAEFEAFLAAGGHDDKCTHVVGTAAKIAAAVLLDAGGDGSESRR